MSLCGPSLHISSTHQPTPQASAFLDILLQAPLWNKIVRLSLGINESTSHNSQLIDVHFSG